MNTDLQGTPPVLRGAWLRQQLDDTAMGAIHPSIQSAVEQASIPSGARIAIAVGSRGMDRLVEIVGCLVKALQARGAHPFVIPAMGSHGGASADGQIAVLTELGVTSDAVGCPVEATMETVTADPVDRLAYEADGVIPINRIKPHTSFEGPHGSGLLKMVAVGLGNRVGAAALHAEGYANFGARMRRTAQQKLRRLTVLFGVATVENGLGRLALLECVDASDFETRDAALLVEAKRRMARLPVSELDVLLVDQIGKEISGVGMDPNVIGRDHRGQRAAGPHIQRIVVRGLSVATRGHATGIGLADFVLRRAIQALDRQKTWMNALTARTPEYARLPLSVESDQAGLAAALLCSRPRAAGGERVLWVQDTHCLETFWASEALLPELTSNGRCCLQGAVTALRFDPKGMLLKPSSDTRT